MSTMLPTDQEIHDAVACLCTIPSDGDTLSAKIEALNKIANLLNRFKELAELYTETNIRVGDVIDTENVDGSRIRVLSIERAA